MASHPAHHALGIDIGRVIIGPVLGGRADTSFLGGSFERAMQTPPTEGCFETIARLVEAFDGHAYLVSKCGSSVQDKTWHWLRHHDFWHLTGMKPSKVRFCLTRPEKAGICAELGITHFIDDRVDIIESLEGIVGTRILFGEQEGGVLPPPGSVAAGDWAEVRSLVMASRASV